MPTRTPNLNLEKPEIDDFVDLNVLNDNLDTLDSVIPPTGGFSQAGATVKMGFADTSYHWHLITIASSTSSVMGAWLVYFTTGGSPYIFQIAKGSGVTNVAADGSFGLAFTFSSGTAADATKRFNDISFRGSEYIGYNNT